VAGTQITLHPCAKINLGLYITGKRSDGYHTLETIFLPVTLFDTLLLRKRKKSISLNCSSSNIPSGKSNLAFQAALKYFEAWGRNSNKHGVSIRLKKRIPAGGGLGGGSSDAAYTLIGLQRLFEYPLNNYVINKIAQRLGADVPFFLKSRASVGQGIGEKLTPLNHIYPGWILLIWPDYSISTGDVFKRVTKRLIDTNKSGDLKKKSKSKQFFANLTDIRNDLETIVFKMHPELKNAKNNLLKNGAEYSSLSGSGSVVYGLFSEKKLVSQAAKLLSSQFRTEITKQFESNF